MIMKKITALLSRRTLWVLFLACSCFAQSALSKSGEQENWYQFQWPTVSTETNFLNIPLNDGASLDNDSNAISQFGEDLNLVSGQEIYNGDLVTFQYDVLHYISDRIYILVIFNDDSGERILIECDLRGNLSDMKKLDSSPPNHLDPTGIRVQSFIINESGKIFTRHPSWIEKSNDIFEKEWKYGIFRSNGIDDLETDYQFTDFCISPNGNIFVGVHYPSVLEYAGGEPTPSHNKVFIINQSGELISKFPETNSTSTAPGFFGKIVGMGVMPNGNLLLYDDSGSLHLFSENGEFIKRKTGLNNTENENFALSTTGRIYHDGEILDQDFEIVPTSGLGRGEAQWSHAGDLVFGDAYNLSLMKSAYRTKGSITPNEIPQPVIRSVAQRAGTNILDIDFEVIDVDDSTAVAGLIASIDGNFDDLTKLIVPQSYVDGTDSKIGQSIATNQVHRASWYVRGDWAEPSGDLKIGILARDARREKPVDVHFLELPFEEGNLTISRSPIKDPDISNFLLYEMATGNSSFSLEYGKIKDQSGAVLAENGSYVVYFDEESNAQESKNGIISTETGRNYFINALSYRWASVGEVAMAKEASTPGTINQYNATNQVVPRNLPGKVNEYGFDVGFHGSRAWWVVKTNDVDMPQYSLNNELSTIGNEPNSFLGRVVDISPNSYSEPISLTFIATGGKPKSYWDEESNQYGPIYRGIIGLNSTVTSSQPAVFDFGIYNAGFGKSSLLDDQGRDSATKSISIAGDTDQTIAVGSSQEDLVYLFKNNQLIQTLAPNNPESGERFGASVRFPPNYLFDNSDSPYLAIGSPFRNSNGEEKSGAVSIFKRNGDSFVHFARITDPKSRAGGRFGQFFEFGSNDLLFIGDPTGPNADGDIFGAVYVYKIEGEEVNLIQSFSTTDFEDLDYWASGYEGLGCSISVHENLLLVGARSHSSPGAPWSGSVVVFEISNEGLIKPVNKIISPKAVQGGRFGAHIHFDGARLIVGAPNEFSKPGVRGGAAYIYRILEDGRATLLDRVVHPTIQEGAFFGESVAISGLSVVVGSPGYDISESEANVGSIHLFQSEK